MTGEQNQERCALGTALHLLLALLAAPPAAWLASRVAVRYAAANGAPILIAMALAFAWAAAIAPDWPVLGMSLALGWTLVALAAVDLASFRLPDLLTLPLILAGLGATALMPARPMLDHLAGAGAGWGSLVVLALAYRWWRGVEGVGQGDAKLLGAAGAWLGWRPLPSVLLIACAAAFVWVGFRTAARGRAALNERLAFGAPLCLAIWTVWLHGPLAI
ncbi:MAG: prepilin peptidase [Caulobacteraceae bacterium]|nr:prepilin peptidase [Caulobacteraceae bacterium]